MAFSRIKPLLAGLAVALLGAGSAYGWDPYTAKNIEATAESKSATEARAKAMEKAERKAYEKIAQQLQLSPKALTADQISRMVTGFELVEEQVGSNSYRAVVHMSFNPSQVRAVTGQSPRPIAPPPEELAAEEAARAKQVDALTKAAEQQKAKAAELAATMPEKAATNPSPTPQAAPAAAATTTPPPATPAAAQPAPSPSGSAKLSPAQVTKPTPAYSPEQLAKPSRAAAFAPTNDVTYGSDAPADKKDLASTMQNLAAKAPPRPAPPPPTAVQAGQMGVLLLPVLRTPQKTMLWEEGNIWRSAWQRQPLDSSRPLLVLPMGDMEDIATLDAGQLKRADRAGLQRLASRYGASEILLMEANLIRLSSGNQMQVRMTPIGIYGTPRTPTATFNVGSGEYESKLMDVAVAEALNRMGQPLNLRHAAELQAKNNSAPAGGEKIKLVIPLRSMVDWVKIRQEMESFPEVAGIDIIAMSPNQADVTANLKTDTNSFTTRLLEKGYTTHNREGYWVVKPPAGE